MKFAYYNEFDPQKAAWLRELIKRNLIAPGEVDERSIKDVNASELVGYTQCHFFAGIGIWSYALRLAGWADDRSVWTGSCPCPSFSGAGKGEGFADARHLWPDWYRLIRECRPSVVFGEQVAAAIGHGWLDLVCGEMEAEEYAIAAAVLGAHSAGAPHIRQRLYFCAAGFNPDTECNRGLIGRRPDEKRDASSGGSQEAERGAIQRQTEGFRNVVNGSHADCESSKRGTGSVFRAEGNAERLMLDGSDSVGSQHGVETGIGSDTDGGNAGAERKQRSGEQRLLAQDSGTSDVRDSEERRLAVCGLSSWDSGHASRSSELGVEIDAKFEGLEGHFGHVRAWRGPGWLDPLTARSIAETGATRGFWGDCDWWFGRDGKYRPTGPGVQPLAHGVAARVVKLRGYGDGIVSESAAHFIAAAMEIL